jgi:hypothetical protein
MIEFIKNFFYYSIIIIPALYAICFALAGVAGLLIFIIRETRKDEDT